LRKWREARILVDDLLPEPIGGDRSVRSPCGGKRHADAQMLLGHNLLGWCIEDDWWGGVEMLWLRGFQGTIGRGAIRGR
jgi:hypothetical protein